MTEHPQLALIGRPTAPAPVPPVDGWRTVLDLVVPGQPVGASRPKFVRATGRTYKPQKHAAWEAVGTLAIAEAWGDQEPLDAHVRVDIVLVLERPAKLVPRRQGGSMSGPAERRALDALGLASLDGRLPAPSKPDIDNAEKLVLDCLTRAGVLVDDSRVVETRPRKRWAAIGEGPCTEIVVFVGPGGRWWG